MASKRESILDAMVSALESSGGPANLSVSRSMVRAIGESQLPLIVVFPLKEKIEVIGSQRNKVAKRELLVAVDGYANCEDGNISAAVDELACWMTKSIGRDRSLGGLTLTCDEVWCGWDGSDNESENAKIQVHFQITYQTSTEEQV